MEIDINCDVGEGVGNESLILPLISSCNIACGGHAGNSASMRKVIKLALKHNVKIGAHPSYPDQENFGRLSIEISSKDLIKSIREQLKNFAILCNSEKAILHHIKPHGALYNDIAKDKKLARVFLTAILPYKSYIKLYVPFNSVIAEEAKKQGFSILKEVFLDRNYHQDLSLVSRKEPNAILEKPEEVLQHVTQMVKNKQVKTIDNKLISIAADTYCIHGDTSSAYKILTYLHIELPKLNIAIKK